MSKIAKLPSEISATVDPAKELRARWFVLGLALLALTAKLFIAWNTFGTNDVITFYLFSKDLVVHGLGWTYKNVILFNHPPLTAYYLEALYRFQHLPIAHACGLTFPFLLRLPGILADFATVLTLLAFRNKDGRRLVPTWALAIFSLSPLSLMVSGFHGNTDPVMVLFLVLATYSATRRNAELCGLFLALSVQVKIAPLLFAPIFFFFWWHRGKVFRFLWPFTLTSLLLWSEPLFLFPRLFFHNVVSYSSFWGFWGISYLLRATGRPEFDRVSFFSLSPEQNLVVNICKLLIIVAVLSLAWRRRPLGTAGLRDTIAYAWLMFFIFAPGVCTQYLIWIAPFLLLLSPGFYLCFMLSSSIFAFVFYNGISDGFPWYHAVSTTALVHVWAPWTLLPWLTVIAGGTYFLRRGMRANPSLRLFSLRPLRPEDAGSSGKLAATLG